MTIDFKALMPDPRDVPAPPGSINAELLALPQRREYTHDLKGALLYFPRSDQVMVPFQAESGGHWSCVVVFNGSRAPRRENGRLVYPRGGYNLDVSELEMQTAIELTASELWAVEITVGERPDPMEMPVQDYAGAKTVAAANREHGHQAQIIQSLHVEPTDGGWDVEG
ncbi:MAG: hypothetical protein K0S37_756 [Microbacterium sp.]|jgi:hypothetical protein|nr:hypothetical protein [Microbacterium sp.]